MSTALDPDEPGVRELVVAALGPARSLRAWDFGATRTDGRFLKINFFELDAHGRPRLGDGTLPRYRRKRVRLPKGHPWRGRRP